MHGRRGIPKVQHQLRAGLREIAHLDRFGFERRRPFIDKALITLGARHCHFLLVMEQCSGIAGADDRR